MEKSNLHQDELDQALSHLEDQSHSQNVEESVPQEGEEVRP